MTLRSRVVVASALVVLGACMASAGVGCNSISGVGDLVVGGGTDGASPELDGTTGEGGGSTGDARIDGEGSTADGPAADGSETDGAKGDASAPADGGSDVAQGADVGTDGSQGSEASMDAGVDVSADVEHDAPVDSGADAAADGSPADAPHDSPSSSGPCDGGTPYVMHSNGFGQSFYDCAPLGTYNVTQGFEACAASTGDAGACSVNPGGLNCSAGNLVCAPGASSCMCWRFDGHPGAIDTFTGACGCIPAAAPVVWN